MTPGLLLFSLFLYDSLERRNPSCPGIPAPAAAVVALAGVVRHRKLSASPVKVILAPLAAHHVWVPAQ